MILVLLNEYSDVFALSYVDMPWVNTYILVHDLPLRPKFKPVKTTMSMKLEWNMKIKEEVIKQLESGFLEVTDYPNEEFVTHTVHQQAPCATY